MRFIKATYHLETKTVEYEAGDGTRLLNCRDIKLEI